MAAATELPRIVLRDGRERPIRRGHPWVLSGSVERVEGDPEAGAPVHVVDCRGQSLGAILVLEDVTDVILNLKEVRLRLNAAGPKELELNKKGPGAVTASDFWSA